MLYAAQDFTYQVFGGLLYSYAAGALKQTRVLLCRRRFRYLFETVIVEFCAEVRVAASHHQDAICSPQAEVYQLAQVLILTVPGTSRWVNVYMEVRRA